MAGNTIEVNYRKRKSKGLFASLSKHYALDNLQLYNPLYTRFFALSESNYNQVEFNQEWSLDTVSNATGTISSQGVSRTVPIFLKMAPMLNPYTYITGTYAGFDTERLPTLTTDDLSIATTEMNDPSNAAYVDAFFVYLSSMLRNRGFIHGLEYYGAFLGIKSEFAIDICDEVEYLAESPFFMRERGRLFTVRDYDFIFDEPSMPELTITAANNLELEFDSIDDCAADCAADCATNMSCSCAKSDANILCEHCITDVPAKPTEVIELNNPNSSETCSSSGSTVSSRDSNTDDEADAEVEDEYEDSSSNSSNGDIDEEDEEVILLIKRFPVQVIAMERCENTMCSLVDDLDDKQLFAALFQVIAALIAYQRVFDFTHNDLHSNNIMWTPTAKKWLLYTIDGKTYRVPTHGRIFKIIDFGRAIYRYNNQMFVGSSFQKGGEAAAQYNFGPCLNPQKPIVEPNPSFDLCRFAVSMFDMVVDDFRTLPPAGTIARLMYEWCCDDRGKNILYKRNGDERYPDFKLYKMIARTVHNHTPRAQLLRPEFAAFLSTNNTNNKPLNPAIVQTCNIDALPVCFNP